MFLFLFICALLVPLTMVILGNSYRKKPPLDKDGASGYRTTMSRMNQDTWTYAHTFVGKVWLILGILLSVITVAVMIRVGSHGNFELLATYLVFIQLGCMILTIVPVEIRLHTVFDKNGLRKK